tara:strand:- start:1299 stop:1787 length:489 start_codon:yes stop_codon:yes gene_type:complete
MALFSKNIIEAYFLNKENTIIEILYRKEGKNYSYSVEVNNDHPDYQDLIKEYSLERIEETTIKRHKQIRNQTKELARQFSGEYLQELKQKHKEEIKKLKTKYEWKNLLKYIESDDQDELFKLKLELFELDVIKNGPKESLDKIRNSKTFMEVLQEFKKICSM